nr:hypothetical protein [Amycolatopsis sp. CB00013]
MAAADLVTILRDEAKVVPVSQHQRQLVDRDLLRRPTRRRTGAKSSLIQLIGQVLKGVVAGGVELERQLDERSSLRIHRDRPDLATFGLQLSDVQVAESRHSDRAAVSNLLSHLVADVRSARLGLILIDCVQDRLHKRALRTLPHVQDGRHHTRTDLLQVSFGDPSIHAVPEDPVEVVDDDVVDVLLSFDPGDHLLELRALVDAGRGPARLDKLPNDVSF